jgi:hypothetical protein
MSRQRAASTETFAFRGFVSKHSEIDTERLAALMDGKLSASEAAAVRAQLAGADPETIAAYADAVAIANELGLTAPTAAEPRGARSACARRSFTGWAVLGLAAAAVLAFIFVSGPRADAASAARLVASLPTTVTVPTTEAWPARRGANDDMPARVRAARLGASFVDFELAVRTTDTAAVRRSASSIVSLAEGLPGTAGITAQYRDIASGHGVALPHPGDPDRQKVNSAVARIAGQTYVNAGAAAEVVRAVASTGDSAAVARLCNQSTDLRRALSVAVGQIDAINRDSLVSVLRERSCRATQVRDFSSAFLSSLTR